jgi:hypothetical protein
MYLNIRVSTYVSMYLSIYLSIYLTWGWGHLVGGGGGGGSGKVLQGCIQGVDGAALPWNIKKLIKGKYFQNS